MSVKCEHGVYDDEYCYECPWESGIREGERRERARCVALLERERRACENNARGARDRMRAYHEGSAQALRMILDMIGDGILDHEKTEKAVMGDAVKEWTPPYCVRDDDNGLRCPKCAEESVCIREHEMYLDGCGYEAYCGECHATMTVYACVDIAFAQPEAEDLNV